jgi:hypothetical protein
LQRRIVPEALLFATESVKVFGVRTTTNGIFMSHDLQSLSGAAARFSMEMLRQTRSLHNFPDGIDSRSAVIKEFTIPR